MKRIIYGFQVIQHTRTSDDRGRFYETHIRSRHTAVERKAVEQETRAMAMAEASAWASNHAAAFGEGRASVYRATLTLHGRALQPKRGEG